MPSTLTSTNANGHVKTEKLVCTCYSTGNINKVKSYHKGECFA
jgi:hypothetical protein